MADLGKQGTASPVYTAEPIKAGVPTSTDKTPGGPGATQIGVQVPGVGNNDKRKAK